MNIKKRETHKFQSEVKNLLNLMIHSLYSNKEIFLRELISNASDAADKLRFRALSQPNLYKEDVKLRVRISFNKEQRTITLNDNGIGMCREEVIDNLGTIAKSGTKAFLESIGSDHLKDSQLIGQFGVGFYSVFIVAEKVNVRTRSAIANADEGVLWESSGTGDYSISNIIKEERGTEITLYLREGEDEFLDQQRLKSVIGKYSDHIMLPVEIEVATTGDKKITTWEKINKAQALWVRNKADIREDEYKEFYKHLSHDFNDPLSWSHNRVEGKHEYISLLYIPGKAPWDMWNREHKQGLKLYVQRVFIMDDATQFMPNYLRFVKGVIDSNDLPLNVSREILQDSRITQNLKSTLTKRVLLILEKMAKDEIKKYQLFWKEFGLVVKEGLGEDSSNIEILAKLLRFSSTYGDSSEQITSLEEYMERMVEGQEKIYYITADSYTAAKSSPHLELFLKKGIEVLLLSDRIDEWMLSFLTEFNGKSLQLVSKADATLDKLISEGNEEQKEVSKVFEPFIKRVKAYLGEKIKDVRLTDRLTDSPAVVTIEANDVTTQMAKLFVATGQTLPKVKYILELNPKSSMIKHIADISEADLFGKWIDLLIDQVLLAEQGTLDDPHKFIRGMNYLLNLKK